MPLMLEAADSAVIFLTAILTTAVHSVFGFSLIAGGNFKECLRFPATMPHFFKQWIFRIF
jgi:hypothetical protein